jgi:hypothetical protein
MCFGSHTLKLGSRSQKSRLCRPAPPSTKRNPAAGSARTPLPQRRAQSLSARSRSRSQRFLLAEAPRHRRIGEVKRAYELKLFMSERRQVRTDYGDPHALGRRSSHSRRSCLLAVVRRIVHHLRRPHRRGLRVNSPSAEAHQARRGHGKKCDVHDKLLCPGCTGGKEKNSGW